MFSLYHVCCLKQKLYVYIEVYVVQEKHAATFQTQISPLSLLWIRSIAPILLIEPS